ncbi:MAG: hypothetical protein ACXWDN_14550 [Limisphaerales bacterium]
MNTSVENKQFRQGDILIELVAEIPDVATRQERSRQVTLAYGEMTGHQHVLETEDPAVWWTLEEASSGHVTIGLGASELFLSISADGTVNHPEHAPIQLPPGSYRVTRQREYSPAAIRRVAD